MPLVDQTTGLFKRNEITADDLERMTGELFFEGMRKRTKMSAFWILLLLSGIIATAGVVNDGTATVIGAMIVAPLMTPILGAALAFVLTDRTMLLKSVALITGGAACVIVIGFLFGVLDPLESTLEGNAQITSRINPNLIDLVAALATGLVGAFALVRSDVSDTIPGVAIAISLVPPLSVCGLLTHEGNFSEASGALLLFATNVSAIVAMCSLTLWYYRVRDRATSQGRTVKFRSKRSIAVVAGAVMLVAIPLYFGTVEIAREHLDRATAAPIAHQWAEDAGWSVVEVEVNDGVVDVFALGVGGPPDIQPEVLRSRLDEAGLEDLALDVRFLQGGEQRIPGTS